MDFRVHFGQIFNLKIVNWPESIKLQVRLGWVGLCCVCIHTNALLFVSETFWMLSRRCLRVSAHPLPCWLRCVCQFQNLPSWPAVHRLRRWSLAATKESRSTMRGSAVVNTSLNLPKQIVLCVTVMSHEGKWCRLFYILFVVGVPFSFETDGTNTQTLLTSGKLSCCVSWALGEDDVPLAPPSSQPGGGMYRSES